MKLVYLAIFYPYETGTGYTVEFPDLPGCITQGANLEEALEMAEDAASGWILSAIEDGEDVPSPSNNFDLKDFENAVFINRVLLDMEEYAKKYGEKAINKTLSIPRWINTLAERQDINFSQVLQKALKKELGLTVPEESYSLQETLFTLTGEILKTFKESSIAQSTTTSKKESVTVIQRNNGILSRTLAQ